MFLDVLTQALDVIHGSHHHISRISVLYSMRQHHIWVSKEVRKNDYSVHSNVSPSGHCTVTRGNVKQVGFDPRPEESYRRCRSDKIRQTVPDVSSSDRKSSVTDGRQSGAADNQWRRWTGTKSLTSLDICHLTKLVGKVCRYRPVKTLVHKHCIFECNPLWSLQTQERSDVEK